MIPSISIVGRSNAGKTTVLESLIPELKRRGYRVAAAKHINEEVELDTPGKDSWRLARAGSDAVILSTPGKVAIFRPEPRPSVTELQRLIGLDYDLLLVEGYKQEKIPKIEVRRGQSPEPLAMTGELLAIVSDEHPPENIPSFDFSDIRGLADLIEKRFLTTKTLTIGLYVNKKRIMLNPFVQKLISQTITGMVATLKGIEGKIKDVVIWLKPND